MGVPTLAHPVLAAPAPWSSIFRDLPFLNRGADTMDESGFSPYSLWVFVIVITGWLMLSVLYRLLKGKPIFYDRFPSLRYRENCVHAFSDRNLLTKTFGAGGLLVQVTDGELHIRPYFPGNLFFMSEFSGIEHRVPLAGIRSAKLVSSEATSWVEQMKTQNWARHIFRKRVETGVEVEFVENNGRKRMVSLFLQDPKNFLSAIGFPVGNTDARNFIKTL